MIRLSFCAVVLAALVCNPGVAKADDEETCDQGYADGECSEYDACECSDCYDDPSCEGEGDGDGDGDGSSGGDDDDDDDDDHDDDDDDDDDDGCSASAGSVAGSAGTWALL